MVKTDRLNIKPLSYQELLRYAFGRKGSVITDEDENWTLDNVLKPMSLAKNEDHVYYTFWVANDKSGKWIGDIGSKRPPDQFGVIEIGYYVSDDKRMQGYCTEMVRGFVGWLSEDEKINVVCATVEKDNVASQTVLINNGFKPINYMNNSLTFIKQLKF